MWPQRYDGCRSSRQPCSLSLFKAAPCPSVGLLSLCAYFWFSCLLAVITVADVPVLRETHSNHNPWAQGKPKGRVFEHGGVGWDVLCSTLPCSTSWVSQQNPAALHRIPGAAQHQQLITLSCAHQIQSIFRGMFLARGGIFWDLCVSFSHMTPIDFNGSHTARSPCAPLGVRLSPDACGLRHTSALRGKCTSALPCQEATRSPLHPYPHPFGLVCLWMSNNGDSFLCQVSRLYTINITLQGSDTVLFSNISTLCRRSACHWNISFEE